MDYELSKKHDWFDVFQFLASAKAEDKGDTANKNGWGKGICFQLVDDDILATRTDGRRIHAVLFDKNTFLSNFPDMRLGEEWVAKPSGGKSKLILEQVPVRSYPNIKTVIGSLSVLRDKNPEGFLSLGGTTFSKTAVNLHYQLTRLDILMQYKYLVDAYLPESDDVWQVFEQELYPVVMLRKRRVDARGVNGVVAVIAGMQKEIVLSERTLSRPERLKGGSK